MTLDDIQFHAMVAHKNRQNELNEALRDRQALRDLVMRDSARAILAIGGYRYPEGDIDKAARELWNTDPAFHRKTDFIADLILEYVNAERF